MGGCGSKPRDLDIDEKAAPAPVETPAADVPAVAEAQETKNEEPLVDLSEPAPVVAEEAKEEAVPAEEAKPVEEEKKEVA